MKKSLVLAMALALGVTASAYAANPFSDVPAGHWAYDSVAKLAAAGVVDGYADGAFDGDKLMTRYEMAQIVAKAMAKGADCDKLAAEFADELDTLGVRVAKLEKGADAVKITGQIRYSYEQNDGTVEGEDWKTHANKLRTRIWFTGAVNQDWTYTGMIENTQNFDNEAEDYTTKFQRAYLNGKLGGLAVQAGRYNLNLMDGNIYDTRFDGVQVKYGKDVKLTAGFGKATPSTAARISSADEAIYVQADAKLGVINASAVYFDVKDIDEEKGLNDEIWAVRAGLPVAEDLKLDAVYLKADPSEDIEGEDDGYVVALNYKGAKASKPGSWGLVAKYYDQGNATYLDHTMNGYADDMNGFKGWGLFANYALAKNIVAQVEYYDLEDKETKEERDTLWTQVVFTF